MNVPRTRLNDAVEMVQEPVLRPGSDCTHIMALHLDPRESNDLGVLRCIDSRSGRVHIPGFVDRSLLRIVEMESQQTATLEGQLQIEGSRDVVSGLDEFEETEFLGYEDPILHRFPEAEARLHLYCTIPFYDPDADGAILYLGHASGPDLYSLEMEEPVLAHEPGVHHGAKEPAIAPVASDGCRYNLVESTDTLEDTTYSVLRSAIARGPSGPWEYGDLVFHPARDGHEWCAGHASPGPFLPSTFVDVGDGLRIGLLNGRETDQWHGDTLGFGAFTIGLMCYDYENATVEWISAEPLIKDPDAHTITFASEFRQIGPKTGLLYAHVDDSFIRVYRVDATALASRLPTFR
ncbi:hypothetical protein GCM10028857_09400 [Salinarchaeum chitinilyticum]